MSVYFTIYIYICFFLVFFFFFNFYFQMFGYVMFGYFCLGGVDVDVVLMQEDCHWLGLWDGDLDGGPVSSSSSF